MGLLLVDDREDRDNSQRMLATLGQLTNGQAELYRLPAGDFSFEGSGPTGDVSIGVERKRMRDLMGSIREGRLSRQFQAMNGLYDFIYIVIEGVYRPDPRSLVLQHQVWGSKWQDVKCGSQRFMYSEMSRYLASIEVMDKVMVRTTRDEVETAILVAELWNWWAKPWHLHHAHEPVKDQAGVTLRKATYLRKVMAELPEIGWVRSAAVAAHFGSIERAVRARLQEWAEVRVPVGREQKLQRLGVERAKKVWEAVRRNYGR